MCKKNDSVDPDQSGSALFAHSYLFQCLKNYGVMFKDQLQWCLILLNLNGHCCKEVNAENRIKLSL